MRVLGRPEVPEDRVAHLVNRVDHRLFDPGDQ
jgi:hypothetical protein